MYRTTLCGLLLALLSTGVLADEPMSPTLSVYDRGLFEAERHYAVRSALAAAPLSYAPHNARLSDLRFRDTALLSRLLRLREFARLTIAQSDKTRWYLGVNDNGFVGLHYGLTP